jgi:uncharacterized membrane protein YphA (DoxX/SURF4 family)
MTPGLRLFLRILLAAVFLYAAYSKIRQPWLLFAMSIDSYGLLPERSVLLVARALPWLELLLGLWLASGYGLRYAALAASAQLLLFFFVMLRSYVKGLGIDCGCFGVGEALTVKTLARDGLLAACAILLTVLAFSARRSPNRAPAVQ